MGRGRGFKRPKEAREKEKEERQKVIATYELERSELKRRIAAAKVALQPPLSQSSGHPSKDDKELLAGGFKVKPGGPEAPLTPSSPVLSSAAEVSPNLAVQGSAKGAIKDQADLLDTLQKRLEVTFEAMMVNAHEKLLSSLDELIGKVEMRNVAKHSEETKKLQTALAACEAELLATKKAGEEQVRLLSRNADEAEKLRKSLAEVQRKNQELQSDVKQSSKEALENQGRSSKALKEALEETSTLRKELRETRHELAIVRAAQEKELSLREVLDDRLKEVAVKAHSKALKELQEALMSQLNRVEAKVKPADIPDVTALPAFRIDKGALLVDRSKTASPLRTPPCHGSQSSSSSVPSPMLQAMGPPVTGPPPPYSPDPQVAAMRRADEDLIKEHLGIGTAASAAAAAAASEPDHEDLCESHDQKVAQLVSMGFSADRAVEALKRCSTTSSASLWLISQEDQKTENAL